MRLCPRDVAPLVRVREGPELIAERDHILEPLASGGMASSCRAEHVHLGRPLAVKLISRELRSNAEAVQRSQREARLASRLHHPNVVEVVDFGRSENHQLHLVMRTASSTW